MPEVVLDFAKLSALGQLGVRRAAAFVALGEKAWDDEALHSVTIESPMSFQFLPDPLPKELAQNVRTAFRLWITSNALTELVETLALFADEYFTALTFASYHGKPITEEALSRMRSFRADTNLASKLTTIKDAFGVTSLLLEHADSWARARNAITHNRGVIRPRDCPASGDKLEVTWREVEMLIGGMKIENPIGHFVEKGAQIEIRFGYGGRVFDIGERLDFERQEVMNLCLTASLQSSNMMTDLQAKLPASGTA